MHLVLGSLHLVIEGSASEAVPASIFSAEICKLSEFPCTQMCSQVYILAMLCEYQCPWFSR
jgi:hypothetical protein